MDQQYYVTTPIYYVNDVPHLGHAYTTIAADTLARYWRSQGVDTFYLTGTDEHGQKIQKTADEKGITAQELADSVVARFQDIWQQLDSSHDNFIRTTAPEHKAVVQQLWKKLVANGDIYLGSYEGWYCVADEAYYTEKEIENGLSPTGRPVELVQEPSYFFRLEKYKEQLIDLYSQPGFIEPIERRNEILRFVEDGLRDLSISRSRVSWGVPVPDDEEHTVYVWLDALANYISGLGGLDSPNFKKYWPATHLIGKDILRFHAVYWPAFLMSAGLPMPKKIFAHGWWTIEGQKMSKTTRNVVDPSWLAQEYGVDAVRYFVLREVAFGQDGDFSHSALIQRINSDLANDLGNLFSRVDGMIARFCDRKVPVTALADGVEKKITTMQQDVRSAMESIQFHRALEAIWVLVRDTNAQIEIDAPWKAHKEERIQDRDNALGSYIHICRAIANSLLPFLPEQAPKILAWLENNGELRTTIEQAPQLFPRIDEDEKAAKLTAISEQLGRNSATDSPQTTKLEIAQVKPHISFEEFGSIDLRCGKILTAEDLPKSKKLLKLSVDIGESEPRQILAGIKLHFDPADLVDRKVIVVANLKPAKLMGHLSEGMVLATSIGDELTLASPGDLQVGATIK